MRAPTARLILLLALLTACSRQTEETPLYRFDVRAQLHPYSYDQALQLMQEARVVRTINVAGGPFGEILSTLIELGELSRNKIITASSVDWRNVDAADFGTRAAHNLERAQALGARGLMVTEVLGSGVETRGGQRLKIDDPRLDPLWAKAAELHVPVWLDLSAIATSPSNPETDFVDSLAFETANQKIQTPGREDLLLERDLLIARHPRTVFICTTMAGTPSDLAGLAALLDLFPNIYIDTAFGLSEMASLEVDRVRDFFWQYSHRVLWSSGIELNLEAGMQTQTRQKTLDMSRELLTSNRQFFETDEEAIVIYERGRPAAQLHGIDLPRSVLEQIYHLNAEHIFSLPSATPDQ